MKWHGREAWHRGRTKVLYGCWWWLGANTWKPLVSKSVWNPDNICSFCNLNICSICKQKTKLQKISLKMKKWSALTVCFKKKQDVSIHILRKLILFHAIVVLVGKNLFPFFSPSKGHKWTETMELLQGEEGAAGEPLGCSYFILCLLHSRWMKKEKTAL